MQTKHSPVICGLNLINTISSSRLIFDAFFAAHTYIIYIYLLYIHMMVYTEIRFVFSGWVKLFSEAYLSN